MKSDIHFESWLRGTSFDMDIVSIFERKKIARVLKAKETYNKYKVMGSVLLMHCLQARSKKNDLLVAFNPSEVLYSDTPRPESGETQEESLFKTTALSLSDIDALTLVAGVSYGSKRDDSLFELSVVLPYFDQLIKDARRILVINPSPHMLHVLKSNRRKIHYIVTDDTIAALYKMEREKDHFYSFEMINRKIKGMREVDSSFPILKGQESIGNYDIILATARDTPVEQIIPFFDLAAFDGRIIALMPSNMLNRKTGEFDQSMRKNKMRVNGILECRGEYLKSSPKKKIMMDLSICDKYRSHNIPVFRSTYDSKNHQMHIDADLYQVNSDAFFEPVKLSAMVKPVSPELHTSEGNSIKRYNALKYRLTDMISLTYSFPGGSRKGYIQIRYIMSDKKLAREKGLENTRIDKKCNCNPGDDYIQEIENSVLDYRLHERIVTDLLAKINHSDKQREKISLKDLGIIYYNKVNKVHDEDRLVNKLFFSSNQKLARLIPDIVASDDITGALTELLTEQEGRGEKYLNYLNNICKKAREDGIIRSNPIPETLKAISRKADEEEMEIRRSTVKRSFEDLEDLKILNFLNSSLEGECLPKRITSGLWFGTAIRFLTGITNGECSALRWGDYCHFFGGTCLIIDKYVDSSGKIIEYDINSPMRRSVEICEYLDVYFNERKSFLCKELSISDEQLDDLLLISDSEENRLRDYLQAMKQYSKKLIDQAEITPNILHWQSEDNCRQTDVNSYHGDFLRSNFRLKAKTAGYTQGELDASLGTTAYLPFERNYCNYYEDTLIYKRIIKLRNWTSKFCSDTELAIPTSEHYSNQRQYTIRNKVLGGRISLLDVYATIIKTSKTSKVKIKIIAEHGISGNITVTQTNQ